MSEEIVKRPIRIARKVFMTDSHYRQIKIAAAQRDVSIADMFEIMVDHWVKSHGSED